MRAVHSGNAAGSLIPGRLSAMKGVGGQFCMKSTAHIVFIGMVGTLLTHNEGCIVWLLLISIYS